MQTHPEIDLPEAPYEESLVPAYQGIPCIEALPPVVDDVGAALAMMRMPLTLPNFRKAPIAARIHQAMQTPSFFYPMGRNIDLFHMLHGNWRSGYIGRPTTARDFTALVSQSIEVEKAKDGGFRIRRIGKNEGQGHIASVCIIGPSGAGKSSALKAAFNGVPVAQYLPKLNAIQITRLVVTCSEDGRIKGLLKRIIAEIDEALSQNFSDVAHDYTTEQLIIFVAKKCRLYNVGMIVIDEFNNLTAAGPKTNEVNYIINFLVDLMEVIRVPLVIIGNDSSRAIIKAQLRSIRRLGGMGEIDWGFLRREHDDLGWELLSLEEREAVQASRKLPPPEYEEFVSHLLDLQYTDENATFEELDDVLWEESQGMHDLIVKKFTVAQVSALRRGMPKVTAHLIRAISSKYFKNFAPFLEAIREQRWGMLENMPDLKAHYELALQSINGQYSSDKTRNSIQDAWKASGQKQNDTVEALIRSLIEMHYEPELARNLAAQIFIETPSLTLKEAMKVALKKLEPVKVRKERNIEAPMDPLHGLDGLDGDDLRKIVLSRDAEVSGYDVLVGAGVIWKDYINDVLGVH